MTDILIRDIPDEVVAAIDARAKRVGLSRTEYLRRTSSGNESKGQVPSPSTTSIASPRSPPTSTIRTSCPVRGGDAWLIHKSALIRLHAAADPAEWASRIDRGLVRIATVTRLEVGYSARTAADHRALLTEPPISSMPIEYVTPRVEDRALELQSMLAERGQHPGTVDPRPTDRSDR